MLLLLTKDCLSLASFVFAVKVGLYYGIPMFLVHDMASCAFPNPEEFDPIFKVSFRFTDIRFPNYSMKKQQVFPEYVEASCVQIRQRYHSVLKQASFGLCTTRITTQRSLISAITESLEQLPIISYHLEEADPIILENRFQKLCNRVKAIIIVLTEDIVRYKNGLILTLKSAESKGKRVHIIYPLNQEQQLRKLFIEE